MSDFVSRVAVSEHGANVNRRVVYGLGDWSSGELCTGIEYNGYCCRITVAGTFYIIAIGSVSTFIVFDMPVHFLV